MQEQIKWILFFSLLVIFTTTSALFAAEVSRPSGKAQAQPVTIQKSPNIMRLNKSLVDLKLKEIEEKKYMSQKFYDDWKKVTEIYNLMPNKMATLEQAKKEFYIKFDECKNKSYTLSDQKNAGCVGSDTIDACSLKLLINCYKTAEQNLYNAYGDYWKTRKNLKDAIDASVAY